MRQTHCGNATIRRARRGGFTLAELMTTLVILSILIGIAVPAYTQQSIRGRRSAAKAAMMDIANREQQYLLANRSYANTAALTATGYTLPSDVSQYYTWAVNPGTGTVPSFTITFTPTGAQASDGALTLNQSGDRSPIAKWQN
jgi:type IV pilus assembly protein PilE